MRKSAGILLYRKRENQYEFLLVHPGGPFWKNKDAGAWSIPKGEYADDEEPLAAAVRELAEEIGYYAKGPFTPLSTIIQKAGKQVKAWATYGDLDVLTIKSNTFKIEWPYKSGKWISIPEVDKADWFTIEEAKIKINPAQSVFLDDLTHILNNGLLKL